MSKEKYMEDLKEIRDIMQRSSRFISLSGLSGIFAGIFALIGTYVAHLKVFSNTGYPGYRIDTMTQENLATLLVIATGTLVLSVVAGIYFTTRETQKHKLKIWDHQTKRLVINLAIPLVAGGILCLILLFHGFIGLVIPLTLLFYGLALVNASKYTLNEVRSLGLIEIALGLISILMIDHSLLFWAFGFGVLHIVYGVMMHMKYSS